MCILAWCRGYRLAITGRAGTPASAELDFTTEKVNANFSNYSAWHYRARFFSLVYPPGGARVGTNAGTGAEREGLHEKLKEESEMLHGAVYTDPADQSPWIYLRWLVRQFVPERLVRCGIGLRRAALTGCAHPQSSDTAPVPTCVAAGALLAALLEHACWCAGM